MLGTAGTPQEKSQRWETVRKTQISLVDFDAKNQTASQSYLTQIFSTISHFTVLSPLFSAFSYWLLDHDHLLTTSNKQFDPQSHRKKRQPPFFQHD